MDISKFHYMLGGQNWARSLILGTIWFLHAFAICAKSHDLEPKYAYIMVHTLLYAASMQVEQVSLSSEVTPQTEALLAKQTVQRVNWLLC